MKECSKCHQTLPFSEFYRNKRYKGGFTTWCKKCHNKFQQNHYQQNKEYYKQKEIQWKEENKERWNNYIKQYIEENKERRKESNRQWYQRNKEHVSRIGKIYREKNKTKRLKDSNLWWRNHPEKRRAKDQRRRARLLNAKGNFTAEGIILLKELQGKKCLACGKKRELTIDHIVPLSRGGRADITNIQLLCRSCNSQKSIKTQDYRPKKLKKQIFQQYELFKDA